MSRAIRPTLLLVAVIGCGGGARPAPAVTESPPPMAAEPGGPDAAPDGEGELAMADVDTAMEPVRAKVTACADATTYEGKVAVRVTITPQGTASAVVEQGAGDPQIDRCVVDAFDGVAFPVSERGQRFRYSFTF